MFRISIWLGLATALIAACSPAPTIPPTPLPSPATERNVQPNVLALNTPATKSGQPPTVPPQPTFALKPQPPAPAGGQGPYFHKVYSATSKDGLTWTHDNQMLLDHASVPTAIVTPDNKIRIYYVDATQMPETTNCAESSDGGKSFKVLNCTIANRAGEKALDPSIVRLPDGRYRLYYYASAANPGAPGNHAIYSAISNDGIQFANEQKVFERDGLVDPDIFWTGREWLMYVFSSNDNRTIIARSRDGLSFEYGGFLALQNWGTVAPTKLDDGRFRLYAFSPSSEPHVASFVSPDALQWTQEQGTRLSARPGESITDPFVVRLNDGAWKMFFKVERRDAQRGAPRGSAPPLTPGARLTFVPGERACLPEKKSIGVPDPNGPAFHQVLLAKSSDGLMWQSDNRVIIDQASVPEGLRLSDGRWIIYAVDGTLSGLGLVYAESQDTGKTWVCGKINVQGADPDVVMLPDGRIRIYYVEFPFGPNPPVPGAQQANQPNRVKSAISSDGRNFTVEEGVRLEGIQYTDPDVIRIGNDWFMYISTGPIAWAAQSSDGLNFKLIGKVNETGAVSGSYVFPDGTLRHYFCGRGGIMSATSTDGKSPWKEEYGARLALNPNWKVVCDPSILSDGKSGYWMVYKIQPK